MTFGFSLYAIPLPVILIAYFGSGLSKLRGLGLLEGGKVCHCQY